MNKNHVRNHVRGIGEQMRLFGQRQRGFAGGLCLAAVLALIGCPAALAAGLSGGAITFSTFPGATLNGAQQTTSVSWSVASIADASGTATGWNDSLILTQLTEYNTGTASYVTSGRTLPTSSITVATPPTVASQTGGQTVTVTAVSAAAALDTGGAVKLLSAAVQVGIAGTETFTFNPLTASLRIPASAYAATYRTDATVTLSSGP
jgi:hypothetical protein